MSMCSRHQTYVEDCDLCQPHPRDLFPDWDKKVAEAKAAGEIACTKCDFKYYRTTDSCPLCGAKRLGTERQIGSPPV